MTYHPDMSTPGHTSLSNRMRALAEQRTDLPVNWLQTADNFDAAMVGYYANPQTVTPQRFLGCFARARRMWCDVTGESLV